MRTVERNAVREIVDEEAAEHGRLLDGVLELAGHPLRLLVEGYARRTVFTRPGGTENATRAGRFWIPVCGCTVWTRPGP